MKLIVFCVYTLYLIWYINGESLPNWTISNWIWYQHTRDKLTQIDEYNIEALHNNIINKKNENFDIIYREQVYGIEFGLLQTLKKEIVYYIKDNNVLQDTLQEDTLQEDTIQYFNSTTLDLSCNTTKLYYNISYEILDHITNLLILNEVKTLHILSMDKVGEEIIKVIGTTLHDIFIGSKGGTKSTIYHVRYNKNIFNEKLNPNNICYLDPNYGLCKHMICIPYYL